MLKTLVTILLVTFMSSSYAIDESQMHGAWKLVSYEVEVQETGESFIQWAKNQPVM